MNKDSDKTKEQLLAELTELRKKNKEHEDKLKAANQQLDASTIELRKNLIYTLENMIDGFVSLDENWHYTYVNNKAGEMFGRKPEDLVGKHIWTEFPEGIGQPFYNNYYKAVETQNEIHFEDYYSPWDRWFENRVIPAKKGLSIFFQDITTRKQAEEALKENKDKYRKLYENNPIGLYRTNLDGEIVDGNQALAELLEYKKFNELKSRNVEGAYIDIEDRRKFIEYFNENSVFDSISVWKTKTGKKLWVEERAIAIRDDNNEIKFFDGSVIDITDRIIAEKQIQENLQSLKLSEDLTSLGNFERNWQTGQGRWSDGFYRLLDLQPQEDEYTHDDFMKFIHDEDKQRVAAHIKSTIAEKKQMNIEFRLTTAQNKTKYIHGIGINTYDDNGKILKTNGTFLDISERKKAEREFIKAKEIAIENETQIRALINTIPDLIWLKDVDGRYLKCNHRFEEFFGDTETEIFGKTDYDFVEKDLADSFRHHDKFAMEANKPLMNEEKISFASDGHTEFLEIITMPLRNQNNEIIGILGIGRNITDRKEAENALIESRSLFKNVANNSPVGIFRINKKGETTYVNQKYCEITDLSEKEALGLGWNKAIHPEDYNYAMQGWEKALTNEAFSSAEYRFMHKNGKIVWVSGKAVPNYTNGVFNGYIGTISDITEHKKYELSILQSEAFLKRAEEIAGFGNWGINLNTKEIFTSAGVRKIYGLPLDKKLMLSDIQSIPLQKYRKKLERKLELLIIGKEQYNIEFEIKRQTDGAILIIHSIAEFDKHSNKIFGVIHDITHTRKMERKLLKIEKHEKEMVLAELEKTKDSLVRTTRLASIGQVSATIAHELRNPLGAIRNAAFYLKRKSNQEKKTLKYFNIIDNEISTADRIINNMMQMTKIKVPQKEECMLKELIDSASSSHYKDLNIEIETKILNGKGELFCDSVQILQVFRNLLENANQSIKNTTKVIIQYDRKSDFTEIIFSDNGPGISEDVKHTIFEPLFTTKAKGTGLGLTICKQIIEKHGGHIEIMDRKDAGACFKIKLPNK